MSEAVRAMDISKLTISERLELAHVLLESVPEEEAPELTDEEVKAELRRRLEDYRAHPEDGYTWEEVQAYLDDRKLSRSKACS